MNVASKVTTASALIRLKSDGKNLTRQQYKTLRGQILAGNPDEAMKGLNKILGRQQHQI